MIPKECSKINEDFGGKESVYATFNFTMVRTDRLHIRIKSSQKLYVTRYMSSIRLGLKIDIKKNDNIFTSSKDKWVTFPKGEQIPLL